MIEIGSAEREILRLLFAASGNYVDLYVLHQRYVLSAAQFSRALRQLEQRGLVEWDCLKARLTEKGTTWLLRNRKAIFLSVNRPWRDMPDNLKRASVVATEPYLPKLSGVDRNFFGAPDLK